MCVRAQFTRGTVQSQHFYFDRNNFFLLQRIKNTLYYAIFTPSFKSLVNAIPFAVFLWKCPPLAPIFGNIQDSVDKCVIVDFYIPTLNRKILLILAYCAFVIFMYLLYHSLTLVSTCPNWECDLRSGNNERNSRIPCNQEGSAVFLMLSLFYFYCLLDKG